MQVAIHESSRLLDRRNGIAYHVVFTIVDLFSIQEVKLHVVLDSPPLALPDYTFD